MTHDTPSETAGRGAASADRRKPAARYVEFGDATTQSRFVAAAEEAYQRLVSADRFEGSGQVLLRTSPAPQRKRFRRRSAAADPVLTTTAALARVARLASEAPRAVAAAEHACSAAPRLGHILATVASDLVRDLVNLSPAEQAAHPAYRQTLRLGAELDGLREILGETACADPAGCVGVQSPDYGGRRAEDAEVAEVRAVLHRLGVAGDDFDGRG